MNIIHSGLWLMCNTKQERGTSTGVWRAEGGIGVGGGTGIN